MKDKSGKIIYVGKAKVLKSRVRQYFQQVEEKDPKTQALVSRVQHIDTIITQTESEALILENTLIKLHKPKYNILLKDDKTYPYIRVTMQEDYPRIEITRTIKKDGAKYFGAYTKPSDVRRSVELLRRIFPVRTCKRQIGNKKPQRPCLYYHIKLCSGPCAHHIDRESYNGIIKEACRFLEGKQEEIIEALEKKMHQYAENMEYEKAAALRDKLKSIQNITAKQLVLSTKMEDRDVCALIRDEMNSLVTVLFVRSGKLMGKNVNILEDTCELTEGEIMETFISQFYGNGREIPSEILFTHKPTNIEILEAGLTSLKGRNVKLVQPIRGDKKSQVNLAVNNAKEEFEKYRLVLVKRENLAKVMEKLKNTLDMEEPPHRIEAFDVSNTGNQGMVAGMVVFTDGRPMSGHYRKFKIKNVDTQNDYACMQEALFRRFKRFIELSRDDSFSEKPDLILVDGGMGHVHAALEVLKELELNIPIMGMAKNEKHRTNQLVNDHLTIELKEHPCLMQFIAMVQEEVHRFAIRFHRSIRQKNHSRSLLDEIHGVGPKKKKALLKEFGSLKRIREADVDELCRINGINLKLARKIKEDLEKK